MTKFKTVLSLCIVVAIVSTCILSASAALSSSTSVIWNARETEAQAKTVGSGPATIDYYVYAEIRSVSTDEYEESFENSDSRTNISTITDSVTVTYPSDIPLVRYNGGHGMGLYG